MPPYGIPRLIVRSRVIRNLLLPMLPRRAACGVGLLPKRYSLSSDTWQPWDLLLGRMWRSPRGVSTSCGMVPGEERHYLADPSWSQHWGEAVAAISAITFGKSTTGGDKYLATDTHDVEVSFTWCLK